MVTFGLCESEYNQLQPWEPSLQALGAAIPFKTIQRNSTGYSWIEKVHKKLCRHNEVARSRLTAAAHKGTQRRKGKVSSTRPREQRPRERAADPRHTTQGEPPSRTDLHTERRTTEPPATTDLPVVLPERAQGTLPTGRAEARTP